MRTFYPETTTNMQVVEYVRQINQSPTSHSVVLETLKRSKKLAIESGKKSIVVTYDLAIAKIAMSIQAKESPEFDNVFVALGSFHIELAFFSACGKIVNESGAPHFLAELEILKPGSLNGFIKGKSYNRCKRIHEYLSLAMESLHLESFLERSECPKDMTNVIRREIDLLKKDPTMFQYSQVIEDIFQAYDKYSRESLNGEHGKTPCSGCNILIRCIFTVNLPEVFVLVTLTLTLDVFPDCLTISSLLITQIMRDGQCNITTTC